MQGNKVYIKFCYNLVVTEEHNKPEYALPDNVIDAIVNRKVVLFIGAGVSKQYGVPLWDELGNDMLKECFIRGKCSNKDYDRMLKRGYSALQKVTIAYNILGKDDSYICKKLDSKLEEKYKSNYEIITNCLQSFDCKILTTNADMLLERASIFKTEYVSYDRFIKEDVDRSELSIIHIHGAANNSKSLIFTHQQYMKAYTKGSDLEKALNYLFRGDKTVVFVGYGINDFELLRQILDTNNQHYEKLYMLKEYYRDETFVLEAEKDFYNSFGIKIIPYYMDEKGYATFVDVLEYWKNQIINNRLEIPKSERDLQLLLQKKPGKNNRTELIKLEKELNPDRFYKIVNESDYAEFWLPMVNGKETKAQKNFKPAETINGYFKCSPWNWLNCFYSVCKKGKKVNDKLAVKVLNESLVLFKKDIKYINNYEVVNILYSLLFLKKEYLEKVDYIAYTETLCKSDIVDSYTINKVIKNNINNLRYEDTSKIVKLFDLVINSFKNMYELGFFYTEEVLIHIYRNPQIFYDYCINYLESLDEFQVGSMGALIDYDASDQSRDVIKLMLFWLKEAVFNIDKDKIIDNISMLLQSHSKIDNKTGVYIATIIGYGGLFTLKPEILSYRHVYLDVVKYIESTDFDDNNKEKIANIIEKTDFGESDKNNILLQNNLLKRVPYNCKDLILDEIEKEKERILLNNYGKRFYSFSDNIDYEEYIYKQIEDLAYDQIHKIKDNLGKKIALFDTYWNRAIAHYFVAGNMKSLFDDVNEYKNQDFIIEMNEAICRYDASIELKKDYIEFASKNFLIGIESIRSFIYMCKDIYGGYRDENYFINRLKEISINDIIKNEDYKNLTFGKLINTVIYLYYEFLINLGCKDVLDMMENNPVIVNDYIIAQCYPKLSTISDFNEIDSKLKGFDPAIFYTAFAYGNPDKKCFLHMTAKKEFINYLETAKPNSDDKRYYYNNYTIYTLNQEGDWKTFEKMVEKSPFFVYTTLIHLLVSNSKGYNNHKSIDMINKMLEIILKKVREDEMNDRYILEKTMRCICLYNNTLPLLWEFARKVAPYYKDSDINGLILAAQKFGITNHDDIFYILKQTLHNSRSMVYREDIEEVVKDNFYPYFDEEMKKEIAAIIMTRRR